MLLRTRKEEKRRTYAVRRDSTGAHGSHLMLLTLVHLCAGRPAALADHSASALHQHLPGEWHPHCSWHCPAAAAGGDGRVPGPPEGAWPAMERHHLATGLPTAGKHP